MDPKKFETRIKARLNELQDRLERVETTLDEPADADLDDQAIELEDDEVLEALGRASLQEVRLLNDALGRIADGTFGTCRTCGEMISEARLDAVPYTLVCRICAGAKATHATGSAHPTGKAQAGP